MKERLSIGEVAKELGVQSHTIRFWTDEFAEYIKFEIGKGERRYYTTDAIDVFINIRDLIHSEGIKIRVIKEKKLLLNKKQPQSIDAGQVKQNLLDALKVLESINL